MKTLILAVVLVISSSLAVLAQPETWFERTVRMGGCVNDICIQLLATESPTDGGFVSYVVYQRVTGTPIVGPVDDAPLPADALVVNNQGTQATLITDGIALTWRATGETSIANKGSTVQREFGRIVLRYSFDETNERAQVTGMLHDVPVDHIGQIIVQTRRDIK